MTAETLTIQSAVSIDVDAARQLLRQALPLARYGVSLTETPWDDTIVDGLQAFVDSDTLWAFFAQLLSGDEPASPRSLMGDQRVRMAAEKAGYETAEFVEYIPAILALAKALIQLWQSRRNG
jgi:hypothetical protein